MVHFKVPRDWFETNSWHQKRYSEGGKKTRGCRGLLGRVIFGDRSKKFKNKNFQKRSEHKNTDTEKNK